MDEITIKNDLLTIMLLNQKVLRPVENKTIAQLTPLQFRTLCILNCDGSHTLNELAKKQMVTKQQQSLVLKTLVEQGYVIKKIDSEDRRYTHFFVAPKGKELLDRQLSFVVDFIVEQLKTLKPNQINKAYESIHSISEIVNELL